MKNCMRKYVIFSDLSVFGCLCYFTTLVAYKRELDSHVVPDVFLGFKSYTKDFVLLNLNNHKIEISKHVIFYENPFPYNLKWQGFK